MTSSTAERAAPDSRSDPPGTRDRLPRLLNPCHCGRQDLSRETNATTAPEHRTVQLAYLEITHARGQEEQTLNSHRKDFCTINFEESEPSIDCECRLHRLSEATQTATSVWTHTTNTATGWNTTVLTTERHNLTKCDINTRRI